MNDNLITPEDWGKIPEEQRKLWKEIWQKRASTCSEWKTDDIIDEYKRQGYSFKDFENDNICLFTRQMYQRAPLDTPVFKVGDKQTLADKILQVDSEFPSVLLRDEMQEVLLQKYKQIINLAKQEKLTALEPVPEPEPQSSTPRVIGTMTYDFEKEEERYTPYVEPEPQSVEGEVGDTNVVELDPYEWYDEHYKPFKIVDKSYIPPAYVVDMMAGYADYQTATLTQQLAETQAELDKAKEALTNIAACCGTVNLSSHNQMREAIEGTIQIIEEI